MADTHVSYPITAYVASTNNIPQMGIRRRIMTGVIVIVLVLLLLYLFVTNVLVAKSDLSVKQLQLADMQVMYETKEDIAQLDANVTLRVTFSEKGVIKLSPKSATFNLSSTVVNHQHISAVFSSTYKINEDEQLMVLEFKHETRLTEEGMQDFKQRIQDGSLMINLSGDLKWHVKYSWLLVLGSSNKHTHISCDIKYAHVLKNELNLAVCHLNH